MKPVFDATVDKQIETEVRTIKAEFEGRLPAESIDLAAHESIERLAGSRVPQFVPLVRRPLHPRAPPGARRRRRSFRKVDVGRVRPPPPVLPSTGTFDLHEAGRPARG